MTKTVEAIYEDGVLKPVEPLELHEKERVTVTVETRKHLNAEERKAALDRLFAGIDEMNFRSTGPYPTRDELHDRG